MQGERIHTYTFRIGFLEIETIATDYTHALSTAEMHRSHLSIEGAVIVGGKLELIKFK